MKTVLVTGGAGFIGSHVVEAVVRRGHHVRVLDDLSTGKRANLAQVTSGLEFVEGDIRNGALAQRLMEGIEVVIHLAAARSVPKSMFHPVLYHEVNVNGTLNLLEAARQARVKSFVFASSSSIYGEQETIPEHEGLVPRPRSPYALTKWIGEQYCRLYSDAYDLPTVALRYFNVFGPRQDPESQYSMAIPKFIESAVADEPFPVHGDGRQSRDFTYVDNIVAGTLAACERDGFRGEVINVACGETHTVLDLTEAVNRIFGKRLPAQLQPVRPGDVRCTFADISKAQRLLGYRVIVDFETGLQKTAEWFRSVWHQADARQPRS